jgi:hypothetical protein
MAYFQTKNPNLSLAMEDVGIFYNHLVYFMAVWYILWQFCLFYGYFVYFPPFWYVVARLIWQS